MTHPSSSKALAVPDAGRQNSTALRLYLLENPVREVWPRHFVLRVFTEGM